MFYREGFNKIGEVTEPQHTTSMSKGKWNTWEFPATRECVKKFWN